MVIEDDIVPPANFGYLMIKELCIHNNILGTEKENHFVNLVLLLGKYNELLDVTYHLRNPNGIKKLVANVIGSLQGRTIREILEEKLIP